MLIQTICSHHQLDNNTYKIDSLNLLLSIQCSENDFNPNLGRLKGKIKEKINSNLLIDSTLKKTKFALFWINPEIDINSNKIFFEENEKWIVYVTDERASKITNSVDKYNTETEAIEDFIERLRADKVLCEL